MGAITYLKKSRSEKIFDFCNVLFMLLFGLLCFYPFYYIFIYSLSDPTQASRGILFWPVEPSLINYTTIFKLRGLSSAAILSVTITVICTLEAMFLHGLLGYLMSRQNMPYHKVVYRYFIVTMYVGGGLIPSFLLMKYLGLYNTFWIYILPGINSYYIILTKTYIESIPESLEESAKLDGASYFTIFIRIILPLSTPILATIGLWTAVGTWSGYSTTLIYTHSKELRTLPYILYEFLKSASDIVKQNSDTSTLNNLQRAITPSSVKMTLVVITMVPILCVYPFMQRYFIKGIMLGAVKG